MTLPVKLDGWIKALSMFGAALAFGWGLFQFIAAQNAQVEQGKTGHDLRKKSLDLAHAIRDSLANSWGVVQWRNPHAKPEPKAQ